MISNINIVVSPTRRVSLRGLMFFELSVMFAAYQRGVRRLKCQHEQKYDMVQNKIQG